MPRQLALQPLKGAILTETKPWGLGQAISGILLAQKLLGLNDKEIEKEIKKPGLSLQQCLRRLWESSNTNKGFHVKFPLHLVKVSEEKKVGRIAEQKLTWKLKELLKSKGPASLLGSAHFPETCAGEEVNLTAWRVWCSHLKGEFTTENLHHTLGLLPGPVAAQNLQFSCKANNEPYQKPQSGQKKIPILSLKRCY